MAAFVGIRTRCEIAFVLDPSLSMRVELVSGTEGSLSLNSLLRFFGKEDATTQAET